MAQTTMLRWLICGLAIFLPLPMLPGTALAHGESGGTLIIGGYQVSLGFTEPAKAGQNLFHVQLLDGMGLPAKGAQVTLSARPAASAQPAQGSMEGMAGMEGMTSMGGSANTMGGMGGMHGMSHGPAAVPVQVNANETDTEYSGVITFSAPGHWTLITHATVNGQMLMADFPVDVAGGSSAYALTVLTRFIGLNALIIWAASITKRKPFAAQPTGQTL